MIRERDVVNAHVRTIAIYLPQFHPIPENDAWWGKGFTEWTNVAKARPLFPGHYQPRVPADLGFYDLRLPETRYQQALLASKYGIHGFCYWHYWMEGRRLLERPFQEVLESGEPRFPFCLAWANHTWAKNWLDDNRQPLAEQTYSGQDDIVHARWLAAAFADSRYILVHGRPLFLIYDPNNLPVPRRTTDAIRTEVTRIGLPEPYIVGMSARGRPTDPILAGFDAEMCHQPQVGRLPNWGIEAISKRRFVRNIRYRVLNSRLNVLDYKDAIEYFRAGEYPDSYPCVAVGWDNTARRGAKAYVLTNATPQLFEAELVRAITLVKDRPADEHLVFINAWNEWAEGMYLEPDQRYGHQYLEAVWSALGSAHSC